MINKLSKLIILLIFVATNCLAQNVYSNLWGKNGEKWDKAKLPDFTKAGYHEGKDVIPNYKTSVNVKQMGAVGDGKTNDTKAFRNAIKQCRAPCTVYIPEGTYLLTDSLIVKKSGICIKGEGQGLTTLFFASGLEQLYPKFGVGGYKTQSPWSWSGACITFQGNISESGIQDMTISFPDSIWAGHDWHERAYNGIGFSKQAHDNWLNNITFNNCDVGVWIEDNAHHITADNFTLDVGPNRAAQQLSGHHGMAVYGGYNLVQNFLMKARYEHDISIESEKSTYNVFRHITGADLCIDHHSHTPGQNLFTNIDAGLGTRLYYSGGNDKPEGITFSETYWNITALKPLTYVNKMNKGDKHAKNNIAVGIKTNLLSVLTDADGNWFETIDPAALFPQDLYQAQMKLVKTVK